MPPLLDGGWAKRCANSALLSFILAKKFLTNRYPRARSSDEALHQKPNSKIRVAAGAFGFLVLSQTFAKPDFGIR